MCVYPFMISTSLSWLPKRRLARSGSCIFEIVLERVFKICMSMDFSVIIIQCYFFENSINYHILMNRFYSKLTNFDSKNIF